MNVRSGLVLSFFFFSLFFFLFLSFLSVFFCRSFLSVFFVGLFCRSLFLGLFFYFYLQQQRDETKNKETEKNNMRSRRTETGLRAFRSKAKGASEQKSKLAGYRVSPARPARYFSLPYRLLHYRPPRQPKPSSIRPGANCASGSVSAASQPAARKGEQKPAHSCRCVAGRLQSPRSQEAEIRRGGGHGHPRRVRSSICPSPTIYLSLRVRMQE